MMLGGLGVSTASHRQPARAGAVRCSLAVAAWVAVLVSVGACAPAPAPMEQRTEEPPPAPPSWSSRAASTAAVEAYVLSMANRDRCLAIARGVQARYQSAGGQEGEEVRSYVSSATKPDQAVVRRAREIAWERLRDVPRDTATDLVRALDELLKAERHLCSAVTSILRSSLDYQQRLDDATFDVNQTQTVVDRLIEVSPADRVDVLRRYRRELEGAGFEVLNELVAQGKYVEWQGMGLPSQETFDPEEYERKEQVWEQAQERQDRERAEVAAAQRRLVEERRARGRERGGEELPKLGLTEEPQPVRPLPRSATGSGVVISNEKRDQMKAWHEHYWVKTRAAKIAVSRYRQLDYEEDAARRLQVCTELQRTAGRVLADGSAFSSPDRRLNELLRETYDAWHQVAAACLSGDEAARGRSAAAAQNYLSRAAKAMEPYNLPP